MAARVQVQRLENQKLMADGEAMKQQLQRVREQTLVKVKPHTPQVAARKGMELVLPAEGGDLNLPQTRLVKGQ